MRTWHGSLHGHAGDAMRATLQDIADRIGVSRSAASLALRGRAGVGAALAARIRAAAAELGYHPDPALSMAARARWKGTREAPPVALVVPRGPLSSSRALLRQGATEAATSLGWRLIDEVPDAGLAARLDQRGVRGLITAGWTDASIAAGFPWHAFTAVVGGVMAVPVPSHQVKADVWAICDLCLDRARAAGCRKPGLVTTVHPLSINERQMQAAAAGLPSLALVGKDAQALLRWYRRHRPDVVLSPDPWVATALTEAGLVIPRDVSFLLLWRTQAPAWLSGAGIGAQTVGRLAMRLLATALIDGEGAAMAGPMTILAPPRWHAGASLVRPSTRPRNRT